MYKRVCPSFESPYTLPHTLRFLSHYVPSLQENEVSNFFFYYSSQLLLPFNYPKIYYYYPHLLYKLRRYYPPETLAQWKRENHSQ